MAVEESVQQRVRIGATRVAAPRGLSSALVVQAGDVVAIATAALLAGLQPISTLFCLASGIVLTLSTHPRVSGDIGEELGRLVASVAAPTLVFLPLAAGAGDLEALAWTVPLVAVSVVLERLAVYRILRWCRIRGWLVQKTLVVGEGAIASSLIEILQQHPEFGLRPVGALGRDGIGLQVSVLGEVDDLEEVVHTYGVRCVLIAFGHTREPMLVHTIRTCDNLPVEVYVVPRLFELGAAPPGRYVENLWGFQLVRLPRLAHRRAAMVCKRIFDVAVATVALVIVAPLLAAAAVAVKLSGPGPVLFRQVRVGRHGRTFEVLKLRTMHLHDDADTAWFVSENEQVTKVGRILRRMSIDEIPQLFNVLKGEMSLVGPRPERPHYVDRFERSIPDYGARHRVAGGITGWAQIHGRQRSMDSIPERARFDNDYIENWSLWRDVRILARTLRQVFRGDVS